MMNIVKKLSLIIPLLFLVLGCSKDTDDETTRFLLTIAATPSDGGTVSPSSGTYEEGTVLSIVGSPSTGYSFKEWTGSIQSTDNPLVVTIDSNMEINGVFEELDSDGDGVTDALDACPDTPNGENIDEIGCSDSQKDIDSDGVTDDLDTCPDTPIGERVDENGCSDSQKDTDEDGVTDDLDTCPDTPIGVQVGEDGCSPSPIYLDENGVTIKCHDWANVGDTGKIEGVEYVVVNETMLRQMVGLEKDVTNICTSKVTDMSSLFQDKSYNPPIGHWDVSSVTNMWRMFFESKFNQDISSWDVSSVENMSEMFFESRFNGELGSWDVSKVTTVQGMFTLSQFNQPIRNWDLRSAVQLQYMFAASQFNQPIGNWDVSSAQNMEGMFFESQFNQNLSEWNVQNVTNCNGFSDATPQWILPKPNFTNCTP